MLVAPSGYMTDKAQAHFLSDEYMRELGKVNFEAYRDYLVQGTLVNVMKRFEELPEWLQQAWAVGAASIVEKVASDAAERGEGAEH